jgi:hypothetical protein
VGVCITILIVHISHGIQIGLEATRLLIRSKPQVLCVYAAETNMSDVEKGDHPSPKEIESDSHDENGSTESEINLQTYHETNAGRLVIDPA